MWVMRMFLSPELWAIDSVSMSRGQVIEGMIQVVTRSL